MIALYKSVPMSQYSFQVGSADSPNSATMWSFVNAISPSSVS